MPHPTHHWLVAPRHRDRTEMLAALELPPPLAPTVDAHRRLRGPYTAAGTILRAVVPSALKRCPELVSGHDVEVLSVAPELRETVPASRETLTSLAIPTERTRFYSRLRTLRIAHGLTEFLRDYLTSVGGQHSLTVDNAEKADPTDQELLSVLLRRIDPALLTIVVGTTGGAPEEALTVALDRYTIRHDGPRAPRDRADDPPDDGPTLAAAYLATDCTGDDPAQRGAYQRLDPAERARLHDQRAEDLRTRDEVSLRLGAIPFHRERGTDPSGAGVRALRFAQDYCIDMGLYEAVVDLGTRGRAIVNGTTDPTNWWVFTTRMTTSLAALARPEEAEALYDEVRAFTVDPQIHLRAAYATAMLYTRHHTDDRKDHRRAKAWINEAIALSSLLPDPKERAFNSVFNQNGLALIEVHLHNLPEALRLVTDGLHHLDTELGADEHRLHRSVLRYNRAQVHAGLGNLADALADYTAVIEQDPHYAEYYFDRANILRRLGQDTEALADYERAMALSPPYPEVYYNRGDLRADHGDLTGALADFDYVLELDPNHLDARINRAGLRCELDQYDTARDDVTTGLARAPDNPHLLCLLGRLHAESGESARACDAYTAALDLDPGFAEAWASRGAVAFELGDVDAAIADLSHALDLTDDPTIRYNRATAYHAHQRWSDAVDDLTAALALGAEAPEVYLKRGTCLIELGETNRARQDLLRCVRMDADHADQAMRLLPALADVLAPVIGPTPH